MLLFARELYHTRAGTGQHQGQRHSDRLLVGVCLKEFLVGVPMCFGRAQGNTTARFHSCVATSHPEFPSETGPSTVQILITSCV